MKTTVVKDGGVKAPRLWFAIDALAHAGVGLSIVSVLLVNLGTAVTLLMVSTAALAIAYTLKYRFSHRDGADGGKREDGGRDTMPEDHTAGYDEVR